MKGSAREIRVLADMLEKLGIQPYKNSNGDQAVSTRGFLISTDDGRHVTSLRFVEDERSDTGELKIRQSPNGRG